MLEISHRILAFQKKKLSNIPELLFLLYLSHKVCPVIMGNWAYPYTVKLFPKEITVPIPFSQGDIYSLLQATR